MGWRKVVVAASVVLAAMLADGGSGDAAVIVVDATIDAIDTAGDCSLREAVRAANLDVAIDGCTAGDPGHDTIVLGAHSYTLTLTGTIEDAALDGDLDVTSDLTVLGDGPGISSIGGAASERVFHVLTGVTLTLSKLQLSDGFETAAGGGAVRVEDGGTLDASDCRIVDSRVTEGGAIDGLNATISLTHVWISGNEASGNGGGVHVVGSTLTLTDAAVLSNSSGARGGGIYGRDSVVTLVRTEVADNDASAEGGGMRIGGASDLTLRNVTITGNRTLGSGGGILVAGATNALLSNVTIAGNVADYNDPDGDHGGTGGGVFKSGSGTLTFRNSIIAGNTDEDSAPDCDASLIVSAGHNLVQDATQCEFTPLVSDQTGVDPLLETLMNNGGYNETLALAPASPARDAGDPATPGSGGNACEADDQRGIPRPLGGTCDVGAFEAAVLPTPTPTTTPSPTTPTPTATSTATSTLVDTETATPTPAITATVTSTSATASITASPGATPTATATTPSTATPEATPTSTPGCALVPAIGCHLPTVAKKGALTITNATRDTHDALAWTWAKGRMTAKADFGDPLATTAYDLCVYDATDTLVVRAYVPPGGLCGTRPCWKPTRRGFAYANKLRTPDGIARITLAEGLVDGKSTIGVKAGGVDLVLPPFPLAAPLRVQLQSSGGGCWESSFGTPAKNDGGRFKARSD